MMISTPWKSNRTTRIIEQRSRLYRMALSWSGDAMLADDLAQDAISRGITKRHQLADEEKLAAWLFRILHNCWMEHLRKYKPTLDIDTDAFATEHEPDREINQSQIVRSVRDAIGQLPMGQRQVITLVDLEERSYLEVAEILDIPIGTVMSRLSRARTALKKVLSPLHEDQSLKQPKLRRIK